MFIVDGNADYSFEISQIKDVIFFPSPFTDSLNSQTQGRTFCISCSIIILETKKNERIKVLELMGHNV